MSGIQIVRFEEFVRVDKDKDIAPIYRHPVTKDEICGETRPSRRDFNKYEFSGFWHAAGTYFGGGERPLKVPGGYGYILDPADAVDFLNMRSAEKLAEAGSLTAEDRDALVAYLEERIESVKATDLHKDPHLNETGKAMKVEYLRAGIEAAGRLLVQEAAPQPV